MRQKFYAMDMPFYSSQGVYSFEDRCEIVSELGYDAMHLSVWDGRNWASTAPLAQVGERYGLEVAGVYVVLDLALGEHDLRNSGILTMIETMPEGSTIELAVRSAAPGLRNSDPAGDVAVLAWLRRALAVAAARGSRILLYTHIGFWLDRHGDALRLCEQLAHPHLGMLFTSGNWYMGRSDKPGGGEQLAPLLRRAMPYIKQVNLAGSRRSPLGFMRIATIEPLDVGELDNFAIVALLKRLGYEGYIGYTGWDEGGDAYHKLERSLRMLRDIERRVARHPHWGGHLD